MLACPPEASTCAFFPHKVRFATADEASLALRDVARIYMAKGCYDTRLIAYECDDHWHLGRYPRRAHERPV